MPLRLTTWLSFGLPGIQLVSPAQVVRAIDSQCGHNVYIYIYDAAFPAVSACWCAFRLSSLLLCVFCAAAGDVAGCGLLDRDCAGCKFCGYLGA